MSKIKTPLLSMGARGSLSDSLTFTQRRKVDIAEKKPTTPNMRTLAQMYQRWLYRDYCYQWTLQSAATKAIYAATASKKHTTAIAEWLRYNLNNLPDIEAWWQLDKISASTTPDSGKASLPGTVYGTNLVEGRISKAMNFDGSDNYVATPLVLPDEGTIEFWLAPGAAAGTRIEAFYGFYTSDGYGVYGVNWNDGKVYWMGIAPGFDGRIETITSWPTSPFLVHYEWDCTTGKAYLYWNTVLKGSTVTFPTAFPAPDPIFIGSRSVDVAPGDYAMAWIDNFIVYNRQLDANERTMHYARRYPL